MDTQLHSKLPPAFAAEFDRLGNEISAFEAERSRKQKWWAVVCTVAALMTVAVGTALIASSGDFMPYMTPLLVILNILLFVYLFGNLLIAFRGNAEHRRKERRLQKMNADARTVADNFRRSNSPHYEHDTTTVRQAQHHWYGDHSELNWRDRELAQSMGLDADTYVNNVLERE